MAATTSRRPSRSPGKGLTRGERRVRAPSSGRHGRARPTADRGLRPQRVHVAGRTPRRASRRHRRDGPRPDATVADSLRTWPTYRDPHRGVGAVHRGVLTRGHGDTARPAYFRDRTASGEVRHPARVLPAPTPTAGRVL